MNKKKALSLLLAASMVFSMNTVAFAAETTNTVDAQMVYDHRDMNDNMQSENAKTESANAKIEEEAKKAGIYFVGGVVEEVYATGSKISSKQIAGTKGNYTMVVSANGYVASVKAVKVTSKTKAAGETVTYKIKSLNLGNAVKQRVTEDGRTYNKSLPSKEAKEGAKALKSVLSTIKGYEFSAVIYPTYLSGAVSSNYAKEILKNGKTVSSGDAEKINNKVIVTKKNGNVKKVQVVVESPIKTTTLDGEKSTSWSYSVIKLKSLKKGKDYEVTSDGAIDLKVSDKYYSVKSESANFATKDFA